MTGSLSSVRFKGRADGFWRWPRNSTSAATRREQSRSVEGGGSATHDPECSGADARDQRRDPDRNIIDGKRRCPVIDGVTRRDDSR